MLYQSRQKGSTWHQFEKGVNITFWRPHLTSPQHRVPGNSAFDTWHWMNRFQQQNKWLVFPNNCTFISITLSECMYHFTRWFNWEYFNQCSALHIHHCEVWVDNNKVNRCLARYSPRATTTNRPTNRALNKPAWPGPNWPKMPILGQIWLFLGKQSFFYWRNQKFCYPHNGKPT